MWQERDDRPVDGFPTGEAYISHNATYSTGGILLWQTALFHCSYWCGTPQDLQTHFKAWTAAAVYISIYAYCDVISQSHQVLHISEIFTAHN